MADKEDDYWKWYHQTFKSDEQKYREWVEEGDAEAPAFDSEQDAADWMFKDLDYTKDYRFAFLSDKQAIESYIKTAVGGCNGSYDLHVVVTGQPAIIGCSYGN